MKMNKQDSRRFHSYSAEARCEDCNWALEAKNALGVAAKHHYSTGHTVAISILVNYTYAKDDSECVKEWKKIHEKT